MTVDQTDGRGILDPVSHGRGGIIFVPVPNVKIILQAPRIARIRIQVHGRFSFRRMGILHTDVVTMQRQKGKSHVIVRPGKGIPVKIGPVRGNDMESVGDGLVPFFGRIDIARIVHAGNQIAGIDLGGKFPIQTVLIVKDDMGRRADLVPGVGRGRCRGRPPAAARWSPSPWT